MATAFYIRLLFPQNITYTGSQSTAFVAEARQIVGECTGARITGKAALDAVIFAGNGVTGAVATLVDALNLRGVAQQREASSGEGGGRRRPVVFVGPHEHHSNLLPWRESGCEVVAVPETRPSTDDDGEGALVGGGTVDLHELERLLRTPEYGPSSGRLRIGAFSAASNVTGLIADVDAIAVLLHRYGALAFFDYASGAPYLRMDMNASPARFLSERRSHAADSEDALMVTDDAESGIDPSKDAIYFSPHKLYGGTSTPGVLVIKKHVRRYRIFNLLPI